MVQSVFYLIIAVLIFDYILERILDYLNMRRWTDQVPDELSGIYDQDKYSKSQKYFKVKQQFSFVVSTISLAAILAILFFNGFAFVDEWVRQFSDNLILRTLMFFGIIGLVADLLSTPFAAWQTFVIEERFGFNKTTVKTFFIDKLKGWLLALIIGGIMMAAIVFVYQSTGKWFWIVAWGVIAVFSLFMTIFYSNLIVPLFNKQKPLEEGDLRDAIEKFAGKSGFKLKNIYVIDGSKRSSKANAYFTGLGPKKRIVLYDTLIKDHSIPELVAILAHEIGHYKKKHTVVGMFISLIQTGLLLYILSLFIDQPVLSKALGAESQSFYMGLLAFGILYSPISFILNIFSNIVSRKNEYAADRFAGINYHPEPLITALKKLSVNNLSNLVPHPLYVFFYYSHPPLLKRIESLNRAHR